MSWHGNMLIDIANSGEWFSTDLSNMEEYGWGVNLDIISRFEFLARMPKLNLKNNKTGMREEKSILDFDESLRDRLSRFWLESFYEVAMHNRCGKRVFSISTNLMNRIIETDCPDNLDLSLIKLPFDCIYISFPPTVRLPKYESMDPVGFYAMYQNGSIKAIPDDPEDCEPVVRCSVVYGVGGDSLRTIWDIKDDPDGDLMYTESMDMFTDEQVGTMLNVITNSLLYISSPNADISAPTLSRAAKKLANAKGKSEKWLRKMNRKAACDPILIRVGDNVRPLEGGGTSGWHYSKRFMRRGHWRRQTCGKGGRDRRLMWIEPYWVGPTLGDRIHGREYSVVVGGK